MPESKSRKKSATPPPPKPSGPKQSPTWWAPTMCVLMVIGLAWVVTTYLTDSRFPIPEIGQWNLAVGFALMMVGFLMTMRWR